MSMDGTFRISIDSDRDGGGGIRVEGRLDSAAAAQLTAVATRLGGEAEHRRIDVAGVEWADAAAVRTLAGLRSDGWRVSGASLYLKQLIEETEQ